MFFEYEWPSNRNTIKKFTKILMKLFMAETDDYFRYLSNWGV